MRPTITLSVSLTALALLTPLAAMDSHSVGPRAMGMGGAGTAVTDDHTAQFYNPAMFGFFSRTKEGGERLDADPNYLGRKDWGLGLVDATVEVEARGNLANFVQQIADIDVARLENLGSGAPQPEDLKAAMAMIGLLGRFTPSKDNVLVRANVGVLDLRAVHIGIGLRQFSEGVVSVSDLDLTSVGFGATPDIVQNILNVTPAGWTPGYTPTLITGAAAANVLSALNAANVAGGFTGSTSDALSMLDFAANQAGLTQADIDALSAATGGFLVDAINISSAASAPLSANTSAVFSAGFTLSEVPLTFGYALNDHLSVGGNLKLMVGKVAGAKLRLVDDTSDLNQLLQDAIDSSVQTVTAGVDLGVVVRGSWFQAGLNVRNLNRPVLKGGTFKDSRHLDFTVDDIALDPQVRAGVALFPFETLSLTGDFDVLENSTTISTTSSVTGRTLAITYASQQAAVGVEWNALRFLALRVGGSQDIAESDSSPMLHAGVGVNLWLLRLDIGAQMATQKVTVDGKEYPRAGGISLGLAMDF